MERVARFLRLRNFSTRSLQALVSGLPLRALVPLAAAIFLLFSLLGPVQDMLEGARQPAPVVIRNSLLSGVFALGYAFGLMRRQYWLLGATVLLQFAWIVGHSEPDSGQVLLPLESVPRRLKFDAAGIVLAMVGSYACFLWFMNGTATRYLRARAEIELARQIHQVLVPAVARTVGEYEFVGFSVPSGDVGGDLVDVVTHGTDLWSPRVGGAADGWFGYVADVSGHGVSSGLVMGMFKSALRMRLLQGGPISSLLGDMNAVLFPLKSSAMYVTAACVRGGAGGSLEYAVAGHLPILRVRASNAAVDEITTPQVPVGMFEGFEYKSASLECDSGDMLALLTDGLTEVFDGQERELGMEAVKRLLAGAATEPLAEIANRILAAARAHGAQIDDQTLLLIRRLPIPRQGTRADAIDSLTA